MRRRVEVAGPGASAVCRSSPTSTYDACGQAEFTWVGHNGRLSFGYLEAYLWAVLERPGVSLACGEAVYHRENEEADRSVVIQLLQESCEDRAFANLGVVAESGKSYGVIRRLDLLEERFRREGRPRADWIRQRYGSARA